MTGGCGSSCDGGLSCGTQTTSQHNDNPPDAVRRRERASSSSSSSSSDDDASSPSPSYPRPRPPPCLKCAARPAEVVARQREPLCIPCMEASITSKVKTAVRTGGRGGLISIRDRVALGCSGGFNSAALVHLFDVFGVEESQRVKPRFRSDVTVLHVVCDPSPNEEGEDGEGQHPLDAIRRCAFQGGPTDADKELVVVPLHCVMMTNADLRQAIDAKTPHGGRTEVVAANDADAGSALARVLASCASVDAKLTLRRCLIRVLLLRVAKALGCTKLATGCNATHFATDVIGSLLKGAGFAVPASVRLLDERPCAGGLPATIHPLRDCASKETALVCHAHGLHTTHAPGDLDPDGRSVDGMCRNFVSHLQNRLASTVTTILRAATKLTYGDGDINGDHSPGPHCWVCAAPTLIPANPPESEEGARMCHGCSVLFPGLELGGSLWSEASYDGKAGPLGPLASCGTKASACANPREGRSEGRGEGRSEGTSCEGGAAGEERAGPPPPRQRRSLCAYCKQTHAILKRPKTKENVCKACFYAAFEREIHDTIVSENLFRRGDRVAIGASGGKDSTVLIHVLKTLNMRYDYGLELFLLSVDEGIRGYRDDSLETVHRNERQYEIPLKVVSYKALYGWSMDDIVAQIGLKNNCTFCGVFRRQALDRGAVLLGANKIVTGHNADDIAETVFLNVLRGDVPRLARCTNAITGEDSALPRCKPFKVRERGREEGRKRGREEERKRTLPHSSPSNVLRTPTHDEALRMRRHELNRLID